MKRGFLNKKLISLFLTLSILLLVLMLGPVEALILGFSVLDGIISRGEPVKFEISVEIEQGEILDIQKITLLLKGPEDISCEFLPDGTLLTACPGIQITQTQSSQYQYGYDSQGFLPGFLEYSVSLDSLAIQPGQYQSYFILSTPDSDVQSPEQLVYIQPPEAVQGCSVRANGGTATLDEETFENRNKLNLYVPSNKALNGKGSFTAQNGNRVSYTYQVNNAVQSDENTITFQVSGELRKHLNVYNEDATITLNKATNKMNVNGGTLDIENMDISFMQC